MEGRECRVEGIYIKGGVASRSLETTPGYRAKYEKESMKRELGSECQYSEVATVLVNRVQVYKTGAVAAVP